MSVTIIGTVAFDSIKSPKGEHNRILGGSASYASVASHLFCHPSIVSIVGKDFDPSYLDFFQSKGINTDGITIADGDTFHWKGYYEDDMNQAFTVQTDLNVLLEFDPIIPDSCKDSRIVFCANVDPLLQKKAIQQFAHPELVILDTMNFWIEHTNHALLEVISLVDILIVNDQEARLLTGCHNLIEAMDHLLTLGPKRVIVKKGEHGSIMFNGSDYFTCPALPVKSLVDPTGAGDSFAGSFAGFLSGVDTITEEHFKHALLIGACVSAHTVQGFSLDYLTTLTLTELAQRTQQLASLSSIDSDALIQCFSVVNSEGH